MGDVCEQNSKIISDKSLTSILSRQDLFEGVFPVEDESVEAQLVVEGFLWILQ